MNNGISAEGREQLHYYLHSLAHTARALSPYTAHSIGLARISSSSSSSSRSPAHVLPQHLLSLKRENSRLSPGHTHTLRTENLWRPPVYIHPHPLRFPCSLRLVHACVCVLPSPPARGDVFALLKLPCDFVRDPNATPSPPPGGQNQPLELGWPCNVNSLRMQIPLVATYADICKWQSSSTN